MRTWLLQDFDRANTIFHQSLGIPFVQIPWTPAHLRVLEPHTDCNGASKTPGKRLKYVGMGGFVSFPGYIKYWHYQLPDEFARLVPIHVGERVAPEITIAIMPELTHCFLKQRVDNQAAVASMNRRRATDPRLQDCELLHAHQIEERAIRDVTIWIDTKSNLWADLISRGKLEEFERLA